MYYTRVIKYVREVVLIIANNMDVLHRYFKSQHMYVIIMRFTCLK